MLSAGGTVIMLFLLYTVKKPIYILVSNIAFFSIVSVGSYFLIPERGMYGPPIAIACAFVVAIAIQVVAFMKEQKSFQ